MNVFELKFTWFILNKSRLLIAKDLMEWPYYWPKLSLVPYMTVLVLNMTVFIIKTTVLVSNKTLHFLNISVFVVIMSYSCHVCVCVCLDVCLFAPLSEVYFPRSLIGPEITRSYPGLSNKKQFCKRETSNLSTDADSSTHTTVVWTKNTQRPKKNKNRKKLSNTEKLKNV